MSTIICFILSRIALALPGLVLASSNGHLIIRGCIDGCREWESHPVLNEVGFPLKRHASFNFDTFVWYYYRNMPI